MKKKYIFLLLFTGLAVTAFLPGARVREGEISEEEEKKLDESERQMEEAMEEYSHLFDQSDLVIPEPEPEPPPVEETPEIVAQPEPEPKPPVVEATPEEAPPTPPPKVHKPKPEPPAPEPEGFPWPVLLAGLGGLILILVIILALKKKPDKGVDGKNNVSG